MNTNSNPFGSYCDSSFRAAIASCFISGRISEQQFDFIKGALSRFRETEIGMSEFPEAKKEGMKSQCKLWIDSMTLGIQDELRASWGKNQTIEHGSVYFNSEENVESK